MKGWADLEKDLKGDDLSVFVFEENGEDAAFPKHVEEHDSYNGGRECEKQHDHISPSFSRVHGVVDWMAFQIIHGRRVGSTAAATSKCKQSEEEEMERNGYLLPPHLLLIGSIRCMIEELL